MRIVGGRLRGRQIAAPEGLAVRPTADRTRESLFNILTQGRLAGPAPGGVLEGAKVLDAFAGSGALGLEALSRGAGHATFLEEQAAALTALRRNVAALGVGAETTILRADVLRPPAPNPETGPARLVLMDPPYNQGLAEPALAALAAGGWIAAGALVAVELLKSEPFAPPAGFEPADERLYGKARVVILRHGG